MVKIELHEIYRSGKFTTFINTEYGEFLTMVTSEIDEGLDELEWGTLLSCGISKEVTGVSIINDERRGKFTTVDIDEKTEVNMEASVRIKDFCGKIWVTGKAGSFDNKKGKERVG